MTTNTTPSGARQCCLPGTQTVILEPLTILSRDLKKAGATLSPREARFLVDYYYITQDDRKRAANQVLNMGEEPHEVLAWLYEQSHKLERSIARALGVYSQASPVGRWAESLVGIGPIISAGLLAHIDIERAPTAGHIWNYAGLNPSVTWDKGEKRPWNADLKTLAWKIGESFVKRCNDPDSYYGPPYKERKTYEEERNARGEFKEAAALKLASKNIGKDTEAYKAYSQGIFPPAHIHAMAKRWVVKLFLSHWHQVAFEVRYGTPAPVPYAIARLGHAHLLKAPNWPMG